MSKQMTLAYIGEYGNVERRLIYKQNEHSKLKDEFFEAVF